MDKHPQLSKIVANDSALETLGKVPPRRPRAKSNRVAPEQPISVRFEPEMLERLDRVATQLSKVNANIRVGRSSVVKLALERALLVLEAELAITSPRATHPR